MVQPKNRRIATESYADAAVEASPTIAAIEGREVPNRGYASLSSYPGGIDSITTPGYYHVASGQSATDLGLPNNVETVVLAYTHANVVYQKATQIYSNRIVVKERARRGNPGVWTGWTETATVDRLVTAEARIGTLESLQIPNRGSITTTTHPAGIDSLTQIGFYSVVNGAMAGSLGLPNGVTTDIFVYPYGANIVQEIRQHYTSGTVTQRRTRQGVTTPTWYPWVRSATQTEVNAALTSAKQYADSIVASSAKENLVTWGSSSSEGIAPELSAALAPEGWGVISRGSSGEWSGQTATRIGAPVASLVFPNNTIPGTGSAQVTSDIFGGDGQNLLQPLTGNVAGIHGTLTGAGVRPDSVYTFTRTTNGEPVDLTGPAEFEPDHNLWENPWLIWSGKNDVNVGATQAHVDNVIARVDAAFDSNRSEGKKVLVLGHFINYGTAPDATNRTMLYALNSAHAARYGDRYVDVAAVLRSSEIWTATGITPTQADLDAQQADVLAPSLTGIGNHLNTAADQYMSQVIKSRLESFGWL